MKKLLLFFLVLLCSQSIVSQVDNDINNKLNNLKDQINSTHGLPKLMLMDSLMIFTIYETNLPADSIITETINYAKELQNVPIKARAITYKINVLNNIQGKALEGKNTFENFLPEISLVSNTEDIARFYLEGADSYYYLGDYEASIRFEDSAIYYAEKGNHSRLLGLAKLYKGGTQSFAGKFPDASQTLQEALKIFKKRKDTFNIIKASNSLSILYSQNGFYDLAKTERDAAIHLAKSKGAHSQLISFYYNAASDNRKQGETHPEIINLNKSLEQAEKTDLIPVYGANIFSALVKAYANSNQSKKADSLLNIFENHPAIDIENFEKPLVSAKKVLAFNKSQYTFALALGKEHIELLDGKGNYEDIMNANLFLAKTYEKLGESKEALRHFKLFQKVNDSIKNEKRINALLYYQTLYETEKRDSKIKTQEADIALLDAQNRIKNQWLFFGGLGLLSIFGGVILVRSHRSTKKQAKLQEKFSQDLIKAQEDERTRLARELHDSVGQKLMFLTKKTKDSKDEAMEMLAGNTLSELRAISRGLHPATIEKLGLTASLTSMINEVDANSTIFFTTEIDNIDKKLSDIESLHFYRIVQESLTNIIKHSEAREAFVTITNTSNGINAIIEDNGKGFNVEQVSTKAISLGMKTLLERAKILNGKIAFLQNKPKGTKVHLQVPVL